MVMDEFQPEVDEVEADAGIATDASTDAADEAATPDPLDDLRAQVGAAATRADLESLRTQIRSELGRSQKLEARLDTLAGKNPLADVDPRLDANENLLNSIAEALIDSDLADDRMKAGLRAARAALDSAKGARVTGRMREELKAEILGALPSNTQEVPVDSSPWAQATQDVAAELAETLPTFDINTIPATVWAEGRGKGRPSLAVAHVLKWVAQQGTETVSRPAARRAAAGTGSPAREGAASAAINSMSEADAAYGAERITHEQYLKERERFGVGVGPGGGR